MTLAMQSFLLLTDCLLKVIQQATPYTISQPVAQVVAGFAKVFVGEIIEKGEGYIFSSLAYCVRPSI